VPDLPPLWAVVGQSAVPDALADALTSQLQLADAILHGPAERIHPLAKRLVATWEFLLDTQSQSRRDPRDGALLVTDALAALREIKSVELVTIATGETIPVAGGDDPASLPVWAPSRFPMNMSAEAIRRYPKRPRDVSQIPPFEPTNVRQWQAILDRGPQRSTARPPAEGDAFAPIPIVDEPARPPGNVPQLQQALDKAMKSVENRLLNANLSARPGVATPTVTGAVKLLSSLSPSDLSRATGVTLKVPDLTAKLVERTEVILYHSVYTVVLDREGEPVNLRGRLHYPILVPEPGSQMQRNCPPPGVYVSVQRYGDGSFRIGEGPIRKLLFGGAGSFVEYGYGYRGPHEFQTTIQGYLDAYGRDLAAISTRSLFDRHDITIDSISEKIPRLAEEALPFTVREITSRLENDLENYQQFLASLGKELVRTLIYEEIRRQVRNYIVKKLGQKVLPLVNVAFAAYDAIAGGDERIRVRHALAAASLALKGTAPDDMTIAAKVLSKVMADEFSERIRQALVNRGAKLAKHAVPRLKPPAKPRAPAPSPQPEPTPPATTASNAAADSRGNVTHQAPVAKPHDVFDQPLTAQEVATVERLQAARKKEETEKARQTAGRTTDDKGTGDKGTGDKGSGDKSSGDRGSGDTDTEHGAIRIGESRIRGGAATEAGSAATGTGNAATGTSNAATGTGNAATGPAAAATGATGTAAGSPQTSSPGTANRRQTLVEPGKPIVPRATGDPMELQTAIGGPQPTTIGGAPVVSRHPNVLVGARRDHFRADVAAVIAADPHHPMRAMLDPQSLTTGRPAFLSTPHGAGGRRDTEWRRHPEDWQAGHTRTGHTGDADVLVLQTRYRNQLQNALHESRRRGDVTVDSVVVIGHVAVEYQSAWDLWRGGFIDLSWDEMNSLPRLPL
jgi:hypothetical protein